MNIETKLFKFLRLLKTKKSQKISKIFFLKISFQSLNLNSVWAEG